MELDTFLHDLQFDPDKLQPADWVVDWDDAPLPYKIYQDLPTIPLSREIPLSLETKTLQNRASPTLQEIGDFLWYVYGLTQVCQTVHFTDQTSTYTQSYRRFVPSGGALYPSECYVYLNIKNVPAGVYHYSVAHHALVLLREGNYDSYLDQALGNRCTTSSSFGVVFVSTLFWKNFFKYNYFSYRLQGLDAGVLIGQILEVAKRFGFHSGVYFQFLDQAINHLLGLSDQEESVYAVVPLSIDSTTNWFKEKNKQTVLASDLCQTLNDVKHSYYNRSTNIKDYPLLIQINHTAMLSSTQSFKQLNQKKQTHQHTPLIKLPTSTPLSYDFASICHQRYSPGADFVLQEISQNQLASLLQEATNNFFYRNDLDGMTENPKPRVAIMGCLSHIEGIPTGAYSYDYDDHALYSKQIGDHRAFLQQNMVHHNINLFQVPLCLHVVGEQDNLKMELGYRGYRILQMEAGMLVQRLLLTASALGLGGHPLLGFEVSTCDQLYQLETKGNTCLIQIPIGPYRIPHRLVGRLYG